LVTIVLALIFLGEKVGLLEWAGIALAIIAAVALSQETKPAAKSGT
jgi:drug/metabolite transporter (DMT)-like permease